MKCSPRASSPLAGMNEGARAYFGVLSDLHAVSPKSEMLGKDP